MGLGRNIIDPEHPDFPLCEFDQKSNNANP
jgi:hypothetical protein